MKKSTKGAIAAAAAGVLLLGGAGSLAYWTADGGVDGGAIAAGELKLTNANCDAGWTHVVDGGAVTKIVPGDQITRKCTYTLLAAGDHLSATLTAPDAVTPTTYTDDGGDETQTGSTLSLPVDTDYTLGTAVLATGNKVTSADNNKTVTAKFTVTFPYGTETTINANDTQNLNTSLAGVTVSLVQDTGVSNPNP